MKRTPDSIYEPKRFQTISDYQKQIRPFRRISTANIQNNDRHMTKSRQFFYAGFLIIGIASIICMISTAPLLVCAAINQDHDICLANSEGPYILMGVVTVALPIWGGCGALVVYSWLRRNALDGEEARRRRHHEEARRREEHQPSDELLGMQIQERTEAPDGRRLGVVAPYHPGPRAEWPAWEDLVSGGSAAPHLPRSVHRMGC